MARGEKTRCGGRWTEARFNSFVKSALRGASRKWAPIAQCLREARVRRGWYKCEGCQEEVPASIVIEGKRHKNAIVDHIDPIVPTEGFISWDNFIERLFCEVDKLQLLCRKCHNEKSAIETAERAEVRKVKKGT